MSIAEHLRALWAGESEQAPVPPACCERLICAYGRPAEMGWWQSFEREGLVFAEGGRIVEEPLTRLPRAVEEAVNAGYRPLLLVPGKRCWGIARQALGPHAAFGRIYVRGWHDAEVAALLHGPAPALVQAAARGGRIAVPELDYGRALDRHLRAGLSDFSLEGIDDRDPLVPRIRLRCRLNPFRRLELELHCRRGRLRIRQFYAAVAWEEPCRVPLDTPAGIVTFSSAGLADPGRLAGGAGGLLQALARCIDLPAAYRGWPAGSEAPWSRAVRALAAVARGELVFLDETEEALLAVAGEETLRLAMAGEARAVRRAAFGGDRPAAFPGTPPDLPPLVSRRSLPGAACLELRWPRGRPPLRPPRIRIQQRGGRLAGLAVHWERGLRGLLLRGRGVEAARIGWGWSRDRRELRLVLDTVGVPGRGGRRTWA